MSTSAEISGSATISALSLFSGDFVQLSIYANHVFQLPYQHTQMVMAMQKE